MPNGLETDYDDDELGRLKGLSTRNKDGWKWFEQEYTLRGDGQRDYVIEKRYDGSSNMPFSVTRVDWSYDEAGRLTGEFRDGGTASANGRSNDSDDYVDTCPFDLNGNRINRTHVFHDNSLNRTRTPSYQYDAGGDDRLTTEFTTENGQPTTTTNDFYDNGFQTKKRVSAGASPRSEVVYE